MWRAELVLSDFLLHKMFTSSELDGIISLELGAGTGALINISVHNFVYECMIHLHEELIELISLYLAWH